MPEALHAQPHQHTLDALQRQERETLDIPQGETGSILMEDGDVLLTEASALLHHDGSPLTVLSYKLSAQKHVYVLDALVEKTELSPLDIRELDAVTVTDTPTVQIPA